MLDFRDLRTELRRKGYTARDLAYGYGYNTAQVNRFLVENTTLPFLFSQALSICGRSGFDCVG